MASGALSKVLIDGAMGEGGGQVLRTSLALAVCQGRPLHIFNIRRARAKPGLQPQHLAAVKAAAAICNARVEGAERDSQELVFLPGPANAGEYTFSIGTAGSTSLVLQTILPALACANSPSVLVLEGGTHNPFAPSFDFLQRTFLPLFSRMGPEIEAVLERPGFAPQGGGRVRVEIKPARRLQPFELKERGNIRRQYAEVWLSHLPDHIAFRELDVVRKALGLGESDLLFHSVVNAYGPGNALSLFVESDFVTECFTVYGQRGVPAEKIAEEVVVEARRYLQAGVPVASHLADQLLLPLALAGGGSYITLSPSNHTKTNVDVISAFLDIDIQIQELKKDVWCVAVNSRAA